MSFILANSQIQVTKSDPKADTAWGEHFHSPDTQFRSVTL